MRCGAYVRISKEERAQEGTSIEGQLQVIRGYLSRNREMELRCQWVDDGYTGSNFDRPGFRQMLRAAARGEIDCIVVKDLSRFGREYIQTGHYLQEVFPALGVEVISVGDSYDSRRQDLFSTHLMMPIINLFNDAYCRDISRKVRLWQKARRQQGEYIGAFAVYGYYKDPDQIHRLLADPVAGRVVQAVYAARLSGLSPEKIATFLNECRIPGPLAYKRQMGSRFATGLAGDAGAWQPYAVRRILQNEMYTGVMVQGKSRKINYKLTQRKRIPREQWIRVAHRTPVLISGWLFSLVNEKLAGRVLPGHCFVSPWSMIEREDLALGWDPPASWQGSVQLFLSLHLAAVRRRGNEIWIILRIRR